MSTEHLTSFVANCMISRPNGFTSLRFTSLVHRVCSISGVIMVHSAAAAAHGQKGKCLDCFLLARGSDAVHQLARSAPALASETTRQQNRISYEILLSRASIQCYCRFNSLSWSCLSFVGRFTDLLHLTANRLLRKLYFLLRNSLAVSYHVIGTVVYL